MKHNAMHEKATVGKTIAMLFVASMFAMIAACDTVQASGTNFVDTWTLQGRFVDQTAGSTRVVTGVTLPNFVDSPACENAATQLKSQVLTDYGQSTKFYYTCVKVRSFAFADNLF